jgi:hypothetical protein
MERYLRRKENTSLRPLSWPLDHAERCFSHVVIVIHFPLSVKQYAQAETCPGRVLPLPERCPHPDCQAPDSLIRWGTYQRWAVTGTEAYRLCIQRLRCRVCGRTHSLLPDFVHPYRQYVLKLLQRVIWLYLIVGLGFGRLMKHLPAAGPAPETVREWVRAFAYGAGHLLLAALSRFLLKLAPQTELPGPAPPHLARSRQVQHYQRLSQAHAFWQVAEQVYAQVKGRQARLAFSLGQLFPFLLHWLQSQPLPPRLFWSPSLSTTPTQPF